MKKLLTLLIFLLAVNFLNAQTVTEKKVYEGINANIYTLYDFNYDANTGTSVYAPYDTVTLKTKIISNKGNSASYDYVQSYDVIYDKEGNYYVTATNNTNLDLGLSDNYLLRNGKEVYKSSYINYPLTKRDDGLYFIANENGKQVRVKYNFSTNQIEYGTPYDTIFLSAAKQVMGEGEPMMEIGFTKTGKEYYVASKNGKHYFITGETESKPYDEIQYYNAYEDKAGNICFVAKEIKDGKNYYFLVQGDKEYKRFAAINYQVVFDNDNVPYYSASENFDVEYPQDSYLIKGDEKISRKFERGVYDISFTPSGKIVYTGSDTLPNGAFETKLYIDGKEIAKATSIWGMTFYNDDTPYYYMSDTSYNSTIYKGTEKISDTYAYINQLSVIKSGMISYIGTIYGDYEKNIPNKSYYIIGDKKIGPFEDIIIGEYEPNYLIVTDNGDYAYLATESKKDKEDNMVFKYNAVGKNWKSPKFDYINDLSNYKDDFYYTGVNYSTDGKSTSVYFKNDKEIVKGYEAIYNIKLDKEKGLVTFLAQKENKVYFVEIKL